MTTKKSNKQFVFAVVAMVALILVMIVPTTIAWFTDTGTASINSTINFGKVSVDVNEDNNKTFITPTAARSKIVPGDTYNFQFEVYNSGNVDEYAKVKYKVVVTHNNDDAVMSTIGKYLSTTDTTEASVYDADATNKVMTLTTSNTAGSGKIIKGTINIDTLLPNEEGGYTFNGGTNYKIGLEITVASIQKDNANLNTDNINKILTQMVTPYSLDNSTETPVLLNYGKPIATSAHFDVSSAQDESAYAFVSQDQKTLTIVGNGNMYNYTNSTQPWKDIVTDITNIHIQDGITNIGDYAFYQCTNLTNVSIPDSVTSIGMRAFRGCTSLTSVVIPNSVQTIGDEAFCYCSSLNTVTIGASVNSIGQYAFGSCTSLTSVVIPDSVTRIGQYAFRYFTSTQTIYMEHTSDSEITSLNSNWLGDCNAKVLWANEWQMVNGVPTAK